MKNKCLEKSAFFFFIILETNWDEWTFIDINDEIAQKHQDLDITVTSSDPLHIFNIHPRYAR